MDHKIIFMKLPHFAVYVLYSLKDHQFYIGYTANFKRRMVEHSEGRSKSTACRRPFVCVFCEYYLSKSDALRREQYFKTTPGKRVLRLMLQESLSLIKACYLT
jgi:putative endonuclease